MHCTTLTYVFIIVVVAVVNYYIFVTIIIVFLYLLSLPSKYSSYLLSLGIQKSIFCSACQISGEELNYVVILLDLSYHYCLIK